MKQRPGHAAHVVARRVRARRRELGLTLRDLAARSDFLLSGLSKIERGQRGISVDDLVALAVALDVEPAALLAPIDSISFS